MKKRYILTVAVIAGMMFYSMSAYAAGVHSPVRGIETKETQTTHFFSDTPLECSTSKGVVHVKADIECLVSWDEGYVGWFDVADIQVNSATIAGVECGFAAAGDTYISHSYAYRDFRVSGVTVRVQAIADEWGDVTVGMREI